MSRCRLTLTNDLHLDLLHLWHEPLDGFLSRLSREGSLRLVLAGDLVSFAEPNLARAFEALADYAGQILYTPGNHDLWTRHGDSLQLYEEFIPAVCARYGVHYLDGAPYVHGSVAVVGNVGWYDYAFRDEALGYPDQWYRERWIPGRFQWMDRHYIRWPLTDAEFTARCCRQLDAQLADLPDSIDTVVVVTHHLPFAELLVRKPDPLWTFGNAFMGSPELGAVIRRHARVKHVFCGHSHAGARMTMDGFTAVCLAGNYHIKVLETIEL
jgi:putative phosphoesterase